MAMLNKEESLSPAKRLPDRAITANPENMDADELHRPARQAEEPFFDKEKQNTLEKYNDEIGTGLSSGDPEDIVTAAYAKRIQYLFLKEGEQVSGTFDSSRNTLHLGEKDDEGSEDLLDFAAVRTILSDDAVYILDGDSMPGWNQAAAVYGFNYGFTTNYGKLTSWEFLK